MDAEKAAISISALLERGNNFLLEEQFDQASAYFNKVLDADAKNVEAYWGLVLTEHQCKDELTLLDRGVPIDHDTNYGYVMKYANEEQALYYRAMCDILHFTCHLCFMNVARTGNVFVMKKWAAHYEACDPNGPFAFYHKFFIGNGGLTTSSELPGALLSLHGAYTDDMLSAQIERLKPALAALAGEAKQKIAADYTKCMNELLGTTLASRNASTVAQNAAVWALPAAAFVKKYQVAVATPAGLDGYPDAMADRYMALVTAFENRGFGPMEVKRQLHILVDTAEQHGFDPAACAAMREKLLVQILGDAAVSTDDLNFVIERHPNDHRPRLQQLMLLTNNLTWFGQDNTPDAKYDQFMKTAAIHRSEAQEREIIAYLQRQREDMLSFRAQIIANAEPCLNAAIANAGGEAADIQTKWNAYIAKLNFVINERVARTDQRLAAAEAYIAETNRKATAKANRGSVVRAIVSLLITATVAPAIWFALNKLNNPMSILQSFNVTWFYVIGMAAAVVAGLVTLVLTAKLAPDKTKRFRGIGLMNVIRNINPALCIVGFVGALGLLIASAITFSGKVGTVAIQDADDLIYLSHNSSGDYVLAADIDVGGKALKKLGKFTGTIDGDGHTLSNFTVEKGYWITKQNGTIQNLTIDKATLKNALIKTNNGTLNKVTVTEAKVTKTREKTAEHTAILMHNNDGDVISCAIKDSTLTFTYGYMVDGYIGGMVAKNDGRIVASYVNGTTIEGAYVMNADSGLPGIYAGTLVGRDSSEEGLLGCHSNSTLKLDIIDELYDPDGVTTKYPRATTMIGGLAGSGDAEQSYFKGTLAINSAFVEGDHHRTSYIDNYFYIGGLLGGGRVKNSYANCTIDAHFTSEGFDASDSAEFVGGLVGYIHSYSLTSAENCYAKVDCTFEAHSGTYDYAPLIGYSRSEANPAVKNAFNYGTKKVTGSKGTITYSGRMASEGVYYSKSMFPNENGDAYVTTKKLKSKSFITKTLGWDTEIWKVTDGKLPTLKAYVVEEATDSNAKED